MQQEQKRERWMEKMRELDGSKKLRLRRAMAWEKENGEIAEQVFAHIQKQSKIFEKSFDSKDVDEVSRRVSMLTRPLVTECLRISIEIFQNLKITVKSATLTTQLIGIMEQMTCLIPEIGPTTCNFVRDCVAEIISNAVVQITNQRLKYIRNGFLIKNERESGTNSLKMGAEKCNNIEPIKKRTLINDSIEVVGNSVCDGFIGNLKKMSQQKSEKTV